MLATALVWILALCFSLATYTFSDDHFGRISPARQIARYGALPFRDFFDPGYFLTELASSIVQRVLGDNLLGEMLLTSSFVASGAVAILCLVLRATGSMRLACIASAVAVMAFRRPYDYDKFLFYPLGLLVSWRYVDSRNVKDLVVIAIVAVVAGLFRYDNGLFVFITAVIAVSVTHFGELRLLLRRLVLFAVACAICLVPYLAFLQAHGGISDATNQIITYARREGERTRIGALPHGAISELRITWLPPPQGQESWRRQLRRRVPLVGTASISWSAAGASAVVYYLFVLLSIGATVTVLYAPLGEPRRERARLLSAVTMTMLPVVFILREPVVARIGGVIGPPSVLAAWMWYRFARSPRTASRNWRLVGAAVAACVMATVVVATEWRSSLELIRRNGNPMTRFAMAATTPPSTALLPKPRLTGLVDYLRRCTQPADRVFAAWFVPELYFFSGRAFAGGMVETFGDHWSEPEHQRRIVETMKQESVPLVLIREGDESFSRAYPMVAEHIRANYREAGSSAFGGEDGGNYTLFARIDRLPTPTDSTTLMPCFAGHA